MARADLEAKMRDLLAKASVIPEAPAINMEAEKTSHSKAGTIAPTIAGRSTYDDIRRRFLWAKTDAEYETAIEWAEEQIKLAKRRPKPHTLDSDEAKRYAVLVEGEGKEYRRLAEDLGLEPQSVYAMRQVRGLDPRYGRRAVA